MAAIPVFFKLKDKNSTKPTPINLVVYFNKTQFKYSTGEKINPIHWNEATVDNKGNKIVIQRAFVKNNVEGLATKLDPETIRDNQRVNFRLDEFQAATKSYFEHLAFQKIQPTPEKLKELFDQNFRPQVPDTETLKVQNLNSYIEQYIKEIESGKRLTEKGTRFRPNTFKNFNSFKAKFDEYQKDKHVKIDFQHVTLDFYTKFTGYFTEKNYKLNTIGRHIKTLKTLMKAAKEEGLHENMEFERKQFKVHRENPDDVYLTETELKQIAELDLTDTPHLDKVRDVFLVGCYTAQRFSDYHRLNESHIKKLDDGTQVIELFQEKTDEKVTIPIKPELLQILKKWNYRLPKTYEQKVNKGIKLIAEKAKINELCEEESIVGGRKVTKSIPKHKLITSHTARRTGATLMYLAGIPTISAMKITGHRSEREFLRYIKVSTEENAQKLAIHPYFMGIPLKLVK